MRLRWRLMRAPAWRDSRRTLPHTRQALEPPLMLPGLNLRHPESQQPVRIEIDCQTRSGSYCADQHKLQIIRVLARGQGLGISTSANNFSTWTNLCGRPNLDYFSARSIWITACRACQLAQTK